MAAHKTKNIGLDVQAREYLKSVLDRKGPLNLTGLVKRLVNTTADIRNYVGRTDDLMASFLKQFPDVFDIDTVSSVVTLRKTGTKNLYLEDELKAVKYFQSVLENAQPITIVKLAGYLGHATPKVRQAAGINPDGVKKFIRHHPESFVITNGLVHLHGHSLSSEVGHAKGERKTDADSEAINFFQNIIETSGPMPVINLSGYLGGATMKIREASGVNPAGVEVFIKRHQEAFFIDKGLVGLQGSQEERIVGQKGKITTLWAKLGFISVTEQDHAYFNITVCDFIDDTKGKLTDQLRVGDEVFFDAEMGRPDSTAKWRATKVWRNEQCATSDIDLSPDIIGDVRHMEVQNGVGRPLDVPNVWEQREAARLACQASRASSLNEMNSQVAAQVSSSGDHIPTLELEGDEPNPNVSTENLDEKEVSNANVRNQAAGVSTQFSEVDMPVSHSSVKYAAFSNAESLVTSKQIKHCSSESCSGLKFENIDCDNSDTREPPFTNLMLNHSTEETVVIGPKSRSTSPPTEIYQQKEPTHNVNTLAYSKTQGPMASHLTEAAGDREKTREFLCRNPTVMLSLLQNLICDYVELNGQHAPLIDSSLQHAMASTQTDVEQTSCLSNRDLSYPSPATSSERIPDGILHRCRGEIMNLFEDHGFVQVGACDIAYFHRNVCTFVHSVKRRLYDILRVGDMVSLDAVATSDVGYCRWQAVKLWTDENIYNCYGKVVAIEDESGSIEVLDEGEAYFHRDIFSGNLGQEHLPLNHLVKVGDMVSFNAIPSNEYMQFNWLAVNVWTADSPNNSPLQSLDVTCNDDSILAGTTTESEHHTVSNTTPQQSENRKTLQGHCGIVSKVTKKRGFVDTEHGKVRFQLKDIVSSYQTDCEDLRLIVKKGTLVLFDATEWDMTLNSTFEWAATKVWLKSREVDNSEISQQQEENHLGGDMHATGHATSQTKMSTVDTTIEVKGRTGHVEEVTETQAVFKCKLDRVYYNPKWVPDENHDNILGMLKEGNMVHFDAVPTTEDSAYEWIATRVWLPKVSKQVIIPQCDVDPRDKDEASLPTPEVKLSSGEITEGNDSNFNNMHKPFEKSNLDTKELLPQKSQNSELAAAEVKGRTGHIEEVTPAGAVFRMKSERIFYNPKLITEVNQENLLGLLKVGDMVHFDATSARECPTYNWIATRVWLGKKNNQDDNPVCEPTPTEQHTNRPNQFTSLIGIMSSDECGTKAEITNDYQQVNDKQPETQLGSQITVKNVGMASEDLSSGKCDADMDARIDKAGTLNPVKETENSSDNPLINALNRISNSDLSCVGHVVPNEIPPTDTLLYAFMGNIVKKNTSYCVIDSFQKGLVCLHSSVWEDGNSEIPYSALEDGDRVELDMEPSTNEGKYKWIATRVRMLPSQEKQVLKRMTEVSSNTLSAKLENSTTNTLNEKEDTNLKTVNPEVFQEASHDSDVLINSLEDATEHLKNHSGHILQVGVSHGVITTKSNGEVYFDLSSCKTIDAPKNTPIAKYFVVGEQVHFSAVKCTSQQVYAWVATHVWKLGCKKPADKALQVIQCLPTSKTSTLQENGHEEPSRTTSPQSSVESYSASTRSESKGHVPSASNDSNTLPNNNNPVPDMLSSGVPQEEGLDCMASEMNCKENIPLGSRSRYDSTCTIPSDNTDADVQHFERSNKGFTFLENLLSEKGPMHVENILEHISRANSKIRAKIGHTESQVFDFCARYPETFFCQRSVVMTVTDHMKQVEASVDAVEYVDSILKESGSLPIKNLVGYLANSSEQIRNAAGKNEKGLRVFLRQHKKRFRLNSDRASSLSTDDEIEQSVQTGQAGLEIEGTMQNKAGMMGQSNPWITAGILDETEVSMYLISELLKEKEIAISSLLSQIPHAPPLVKAAFQDKETIEGFVEKHNYLFQLADGIIQLKTDRVVDYPESAFSQTESKCDMKSETDSKHCKQCLQTEPQYHHAIYQPVCCEDENTTLVECDISTAIQPSCDDGEGTALSGIVARESRQFINDDDESTLSHFNVLPSNEHVGDEDNTVSPDRYGIGALPEKTKELVQTVANDNSFQAGRDFAGSSSGVSCKEEDDYKSFCDVQ